LKKEIANQMERVRAARLILRDTKAPPADKAASAHQKRGEMEAFMAIFHPGHVVPDTEES
jgi:hypothetical protein